MVDDRRLLQLLFSRATPGRVVDALISEANGRGGLDNITAIVVQVTATEGNNGGDTTTTAETPIAR
jgi:protein phosphatase